MASAAERKALILPGIPSSCEEHLEDVTRMDRFRYIKYYLFVAIVKMSSSVLNLYLCNV